MPPPYLKLPLSPWVTKNGPLVASPWCLFPSPSILQTTSRMYFQISNLIISILCFSVQFSHSIMSDSFWPHGLQHTRLPCPSPTPGACSTHVHRVSDAIQPSHPLSSPSSAFNLSQHQGLFKWVSSSHQEAKDLELQLQHQSFQWLFRTDFL